MARATVATSDDGPPPDFRSLPTPLSGGLGGVLGEDAIELSAGATNCTSDCQAQHRIQGSLPVPPEPVDPAPIG